MQCPPLGCPYRCDTAGEPACSELGPVGLRLADSWFDNHDSGLARPVGGSGISIVPLRCKQRQNFGTAASGMQSRHRPSTALFFRSVTAVSADDVWAVGCVGCRNTHSSGTHRELERNELESRRQSSGGCHQPVHEVVNGAVETCHTSTEYGPPSRPYHQVWFSASQQHQRAMRWRSESQRLTRGAPLSNIGAAIDGRLFRVPILLRMVMTGSTPYRHRTPPMFWAVGWNDSPVIQHPHHAPGRREWNVVPSPSGAFLSRARSVIKGGSGGGLRSTEQRPGTLGLVFLIVVSLDVPWNADRSQKGPL